MAERQSRVAVLLGAGASADAGLPLAGDLTTYLIRRLEQNGDESLSAVLNQICSAIIAHRGIQGISPLAPLNIERVISSIRLLHNRETHEAAPFVASWLPALDGPGDSSVTSATARMIRDQLGLGKMRPFPGRLEQALTTAVREVVTGNRSNAIYAELESACINTVAERLRDAKEVDYLKPLIDLAHTQGRLDIATLNYDLTIETLFDQEAEPLCRGLSSGWPVTPLSWSSDGVNLFKIHGSIDWWIASRSERQFGMHGPSHIGADPIVVSDSQPGRSQPAMVLGDREKLESQPVTLALISDFERALLLATRLVIVGYSFGDGHINNMIGNWLDQDSHRSVTILTLQDFFFEKSLRSTFAERLLSLPYDGTKTNIPRVNGVAAATRDGLARALSTGPTAPDQVNVWLETKEVGTSLTVVLHNDSLDPIAGIWASGMAIDNNDLRNAVSLRGDSSHGAINIPGPKRIDPGGIWTIEVSVPANTDLSQARVSISASLPVGSISRSIALADSPLNKS